MNIKCHVTASMIP